MGLARSFAANRAQCLSPRPGLFRVAAAVVVTLQRWFCSQNFRQGYRALSIVYIVYSIVYCALSVLLCCCRFTRYLRRIMCNRVRMFCEDKLLKQCRTLYIFISGTLTCCSLPLLRVSVRFASMRGSLLCLIFACRFFPIRQSCLSFAPRPTGRSARSVDSPQSQGS